jgi:hypothetical protein
MSRVKRVDYGGCVLIVGSALSFMIGISWGGVQYAWSAWQTILPIVLGLVGCAAFFFYEEHVAVEPVVPTGVFKNLNCSASYINTVIHGIVVLSLVFYLPLYYEGVKGYKTTITGVALFPETFTVAPAAVIIGVLIGKLGTFRWAHWSGWTISVLGMGILWLLDVDTSTVKWVFLNLVGGAGTGFLYPAHQFSIQAATANEHLAAAVSMWSFFRSVGQTLGIAVGGVILQNRLLHNIRQYPNLAAHAVEYSRSASSLATMLRTMAPSQDKTDLRQAYADSLKVIWATMCGLAFLGLLISFLIKDYPLDRLLPEVPAKKHLSETSSEHNCSETKTEPASSNASNF